MVASFFGAGAAMDAYNVAFRIPNLLRDLFAEGAMSAAFVPTFTRTLSTSGKESAWRLGNHVVNALIVVTGALVALGIVFAEPLVLTFAAEKYVRSPAARVNGADGAHHAAGADTDRARCRVHGDVEFAAALLHPGAVSGNVQRPHDRLCLRAGAA